MTQRLDNQTDSEFFYSGKSDELTIEDAESEMGRMEEVKRWFHGGKDRGARS